jgi:uncharacterized protein (TIGR03086 family)
MDMSLVIEESHNGFLERLGRATGAELTSPTPCTDWDVAELLRHVTGGNRMAVHLIAGGDVAEIGPIFMGTAQLNGADLLAAVTGSTEMARDAMLAVEDPGSPVQFPGLGEIPAGRFIGMRCNDVALHTWDLARAIGADETLSPAVVEACLHGMEAMAGSVPPGMFGEGASGALGEDADPQTRLLDMSGRRP